LDYEKCLSICGFGSIKWEEHAPHSARLWTNELDYDLTALAVLAVKYCAGFAHTVVACHFKLSRESECVVVPLNESGLAWATRPLL
jgi:hypothetical protein